MGTHCELRFIVFFCVFSSSKYRKKIITIKDMVMNMIRMSASKVYHRVKQRITDPVLESSDLDLFLSSESDSFLDSQIRRAGFGSIFSSEDQIWVRLNLQPDQNLVLRFSLELLDILVFLSYAIYKNNVKKYSTICTNVFFYIVFS